MMLRSEPAGGRRSLPKELGGLSRVQGAMLCLLLLTACSAPLVLTNYQVFQATSLLIVAIAILGLNLLTGYTGQISIGHSAFYAVGAYAAAILTTEFSVPYALTLPVAAGLCLVLGFLFGLPALRLHGHYLALATFALALSVPQLLKYRGVEGWTGGAQGIVLTKPSAPFGLPLNDDQWLYAFTLLVALIMFWLAWNLVRGRIGHAMVAIRDNPLAASAMGINVAYYKSMSFGISAMYTGVAGALSAIVVQYVSPDTFGIFLAVGLLVGVVVGGMGTISGALYGAAFIQFVPGVTEQLFHAAPWVLYGTFLILVIFIMPSGIAGVLSGLVGRIDEHQATQARRDRH